MSKLLKLKQGTFPRSILKSATKLIVGGGLIYYVFFHTKMVDFGILRSVLSNPINLLISILFLFFSAVLCAFRWRLLVKAQGLSLSFKDLLELTMIGNFFNTFMPGAVGGDLIKAWYVAGQEPQNKSKAIFTVLLDRLVGLAVIIFYSAVTLLFYRHWLDQREELKAVALSIWGFSLASILFCVFFYSPKLWNLKWVNRALGTLRKWDKLAQIIDAGLLYRNHFQTVVFAIGLSALSILGINILYSIHGNTLNLGIDLAHYFFIVPLGITVSAIPLFPGGIGVGQAAFYTIFLWTGVKEPQKGATLCTVLQVYTLLFNCTGAIFYLKFKRRPQQTEPVESSRPLPKKTIRTVQGVTGIL